MGLNNSKNGDDSPPLLPVEVIDIVILRNMATTKVPLEDLDVEKVVSLLEQWNLDKHMGEQ